VIEAIPDFEWWDEFLLPPNATEKSFPSEDINESDIYMERITHFVQHPVPIRNQKIEDINKMVMPVYLTEKEKKKLCRNKRIEKEKDKQE
jgi:U4/U6 small nuclear ribonucleoprotein PRP3